jgi:hypothetical protein
MGSGNTMMMRQYGTGDLNNSYENHEAMFLYHNRFGAILFMFN